jgi:hypothetical protein
MSNRTRAVRKGVKVAFNASWVDEEMSIRSIYAQKSVRMSYQASTTSTLVGFGPIATDSFDGRKKAKHSWFQSQEGLMAGKIPNSQEKSIRPRLQYSLLFTNHRVIPFKVKINLWMFHATSLI